MTTVKRQKGTAKRMETTLASQMGKTAQAPEAVPKKRRETKMSINEMESKIRKLQEWEQIIEEAKAEADALRDEIKTEMLEREAEELTAGKFIVRWTSVLSQRFDSTALKKALPDVYKTFTKQVASRRFSIAD